MVNIEVFKAIIEENGWDVSIEENNSGKLLVELSKYTPAGNDFNFCVEMKKEHPESLTENILEYYENFDPDYEASLWIGADGHGKNGAPYHIKDIVVDMEMAERMIYELYETLLSVDDE